MPGAKCSEWHRQERRIRRQPSEHLCILDRASESQHAHSAMHEPCWGAIQVSLLKSVYLKGISLLFHLYLIRYTTTFQCILHLSGTCIWLLKEKQIIILLQSFNKRQKIDFVKKKRTKKNKQKTKPKKTKKGIQFECLFYVMWIKCK